jgi:hypothetical protein
LHQVGSFRFGNFDHGFHAAAPGQSAQGSIETYSGCRGKEEKRVSCHWIITRLNSGVNSSRVRLLKAGFRNDKDNRSAVVRRCGACQRICREQRGHNQRFRSGWQQHFTSFLAGVNFVMPRFRETGLRTADSKRVLGMFAWFARVRYPSNSPNILLQPK